MAPTAIGLSVKVCLSQSTDLLSRKLFKMFKLVVLSAFFAIVAAKPSGVAVEIPLLYSAPTVKSALIQEPFQLAIQKQTLERVGDFVESVPTAVSHQSSTVVHDRANVVTPIVAPSYRTSIVPAKSQILLNQPLLQYALPYSYDYLRTPLYKSLTL